MPFKTAITTVFISVAAAVLISVLSQTGKDYINNEMNSMGLSGLAAVVYNSSGENITNTDFYDTVRTLPGTDYATPVITENTTVYFSNGSAANTICWGISPEAANVVSLNIVSGRMMNKSDVDSNAFVCLIDENIANEIYKRTNICGKKITVHIGETAAELTIIGTVKKGSSILNSITGDVVPNFVYMPYSTMEMLSAKASFDQIIFTGNISGATDLEISDNIEKINSFYKNKNIVLTDLSQQKQHITNIADTAFLSLFLVSCVAVTVCSMAVGASVNTAVISRQKDIGIKMSMGASDRDIIFEFMSSAVASCLIGIISAVIFTAFILKIISLYIAFSFNIDYSLIALSVSVTIVLTTVFSFVPSYKAAKLPPIKALNRE